MEEYQFRPTLLLKSIFWQLDLKIDDINVNNKKFAPNLVFSNEKEIKKIRMIFDIENGHWKSEIGIFR